jgi:hypothetical protein
MKGYEIGTTFPGIPNAEQEWELLNAVLDKYGRNWDDWIHLPEMYHKEILVSPVSFWKPDGTVVVDKPRWGFRGTLKRPPSDTTNLIREGVRATRHSYFSVDFV